MNGGCEPPPPLGERARRTRAPREMEGTQQDETDTNSHGSSGNESNGNESRQSRSSHSSTSGNGKDSAMLEATESSKSTNSNSPSPPSSSIAYSLLSASSEQDNPSTSGCSSEQSAREKNQKELMKALKELKIRLPAEKRGKGKSGTLATLQYALSCVKQVRANQEYYQQWTIDESQPCSLDMSTFTIEEVESITSEYTLKNPDTFSVAVSFITGRIVYISDQASLILHCKRDVFKGATFAEFLAPQDVSVFYGSTAPYHLPSWSSCTSGDTASMDYTQEKSVFCRISGGRERDMNIRYHPFRLTPYLMKVRDSDNSEGQPCCLLIAEKIHSGYEAPRIPPDKRIFTTRHTPSCLFQEVDERAVPLLGYLPQDLIGMPVLFFIHPEDRPLMLAVHKKVLQQAGQPFDHSPMRLCARSGEYVTIDTSWSSFVNPWSRKVSFILGRHKVRTSPLNEDVFTAPKGAELKSLDPDIQELSEQIHRILMQPVHSVTSGGNGTGGSNTSQEPIHCNASSSDSNAMVTEEGADPKPMTFQEFCQNVNMVKNQGQQLFLGSRAIRPHQRGHFQALAPPRSVPPPSAANVPAEPVPGRVPCVPEDLARKETTNYSYQQINCLDSIIRYLESCNLPGTVKRKCGSSSYTSSTSEEEKQRTGESDKEDPSSGPTQQQDLPPPPTPSAVGSPPLAPLPPLPPSKAESVVSITSQGSFSSTIVHVGDKKPPDSDMVMMEESPCPAAPAPPPRPLGLTKEVLSAHTQREEQAFLTRVHNLSQLRVFDPLPSGAWEKQNQRHQRGTKPSRTHQRQHGSPDTPTGASRSGANGSGRRSRSGKSKAKRPKQGKPHSSSSTPSPQHPETALLPPPPPVMPGYSLPIYPPQAPAPDAAPSLNRYPLVTPIVALVLPNYLFQPPPVAPSFYPGVSGFPSFAPSTEAPPPASEAPPTTPAPPPPAASCPPPPSRSSSPPQRLFPSRCSSPLQLDLLQMEELPLTATGGGGEWELEDETKGGKGVAAPGSTAAVGGGTNAGSGNGVEDRQPENLLGDPQESSSHNDALSSSSDLLDLLLQEDSCSGTGSAASGSMGSNGGSTSACGTGSSESSNTSKYFGSIDSSETDLRVKKAEREEEERKAIRYVMQDPLWLLMANADHEVMMSYQIPSRDIESVLQEDREKLRQLQRHQPRFSEEQKRELGEVHGWVRRGRIPHVINITSCTGCSPDAPPYEEDLDLSVMMEEGGDCTAGTEEGGREVGTG
ncbi:period circadian protein homolog 1 isoform X2 [Spea bombifrons]|uniref:period circadian protein homolog 1 isoform X2 n=1 Tax=Spea bombifrons TaxID=233779 RepID=UPI00234B199A|nr:period circadian protein homolog 1 isoform X2 [Spea bombifrons]